jgi:dephospho-CoA kinase
MLKIGVTGGIGVGKTIVCNMFNHLGIPVYDSDSRAKWLMNQHKTLQDELINTFGINTYTTTGELNRQYLSGVVFNNPEQLALLNRLVHPHVKEDFLNWVTRNINAPYVIKEAALMFESEAWRQMDQIITVFAPMPVRLKRVLQRDTHRTKEDIAAIIQKQLQEDVKMARAEHTIFNDDKQLVIPQVLNLHNQFIKAGQQ